MVLAAAMGAKNKENGDDESFRSPSTKMAAVAERANADRGGCANPPTPPQVPATAPPVSAGQARIWFYRDWQPSESLNLANIDVNGSYFGSVANGSAFYRDVPVGIIT